MTGFELMHLSSTVCSLVTFLLNVVLNVAAWLIVLTTVDRFVAVWLPLHAAFVCRRRRACLATLALVVIVVAASTHLFWTTGLHQSLGRPLPYCGPAADARFMRHQFEYIKLASYSLAPFAIILSLNVAIVVRLRCGKAAGILLRSTTGHSGGGGGGGTLAQAAITSKVTYMLLAVSATWLILSAPFTLQALLVSVLVDVDDARSVARYRLLRTVCFQLMYANHAVNFFLYCVTGRKFRHELRDMYVEVCCACRSADDRAGRCSCAGAGAAAAGACGIKVKQDGSAEVTTRHVQTGHELAVMTSCRRSTRGSVLVIQSSAAAARCAADTSL